MPESFEEQADIIWTHMQTLLRSADMTVANLVSLRTYLADPKYDEANVRMRVKYLGTHAPSSTVICCQLLDPRWKLEVEAMAARDRRGTLNLPGLLSEIRCVGTSRRCSISRRRRRRRKSAPPRCSSSAS